MKLQLFILSLFLSIWSQKVSTLQISSTTQTVTSKSYSANFLKSLRSSQTDELTAWELCQAFFPDEYPDASSHYSSDGCGIECLIGSEWHHLYNGEEGLPCPYNPYGTCQNEGHCYNNGPAELGFLDIQFVRGEFIDPANYYVAACIRNSSEPWPEPIDFSICTTHCTNRPLFNHNPVWNQVCTGSHGFSFVNTSRIFFEVFDHQGQDNNHFIASSSALVLEILQRGDSGRVVYFNLGNGKKIFVRVTFTKKYRIATDKFVTKRPIINDYRRVDGGYGIP